MENKNNIFFKLDFNFIKMLSSNLAQGTPSLKVARQALLLLVVNTPVDILDTQCLT